MNPFDLSGPAFLGFYVVLTGAALLFLWWEPRPAALAGRLTAPYSIAYLRGGAAEALRVAALSLLDRGLLEGGVRTLMATAPPEAVADPLEQAILGSFAEVKGADRLLVDPGLRRVAEALASSLEAAGLVRDARARTRRSFLVASLILFLVGVGTFKIGVAVARGRTNIGFLVVAMALATVATVVVARPGAHHPTRAGRRVLADLRELLRGMRARAHDIRPGEGNAEATLLAAVFGTAALQTNPAFASAASYVPVPVTFACGSSSSSCGSSSSSCGSSCGGGGCGGGCGGCGS